MPEDNKLVVSSIGEFKAYIAGLLKIYGVPNLDTLNDLAIQTTHVMHVSASNNREVCEALEKIYDKILDPANCWLRYYDEIRNFIFPFFSQILNLLQISKGFSLLKTEGGLYDRLINDYTWCLDTKIGVELVFNLCNAGNITTVQLRRFFTGLFRVFNGRNFDSRLSNNYEAMVNHIAAKLEERDPTWNRYEFLKVLCKNSPERYLGGDDAPLYIFKYALLLRIKPRNILKYLTSEAVLTDDELYNAFYAILITLNCYYSSSSDYMYFVARNPRLSNILDSTDLMLHQLKVGGYEYKPRYFRFWQTFLSEPDCFATAVNCSNVKFLLIALKFITLYQHFYIPERVVPKDQSSVIFEKIEAAVLQLLEKGVDLSPISNYLSEYSPKPGWFGWRSDNYHADGHHNPLCFDDMDGKTKSLLDRIQRYNNPIKVQVAKSAGFFWSLCIQAEEAAIAQDDAAKFQTKYCKNSCYYQIK